MLAFIQWDPNPIAFSLFNFDVRWYSLCWCAALLSGYLVMKWLYRDQKLPADKFEPLFLYIFIGVILGARLGHCIFYEPGYFLTSGKGIIEMLLPIRITDSGWHLTGYEGLASHGGTLGMILAVLAYSKVHKVRLLQVLDNMGVVAPISACCVRLGNLFNSEIVGTPTDQPWGFVFLHNGEDFARHPSQLYEAIFYLVLFIATVLIYRALKHKAGTGFFFGLCLTCIFTFRILVEFIKQEQEAFEQGMLLNMGQILSLPLVAIGIYFIIKGLKTQPKD